jgi:y4mF family transcriptional regulator
MDLGAQLKFLRKTYGLTQKQLAAQSGVSFSFINSVENGKSTVRIETLNKILTFFGCEIVVVDKKYKKIIGQ